MTRRLAGCCAIATRSTARGSANESLVWVSERSCRVRPGHGGTREVDVLPTKYKHSTRKNHQHIMAKHLIPRSDPGWDDDANSLKRLAPQAGFEPATLRLTASFGHCCSNLPHNASRCLLVPAPSTTVLSELLVDALGCLVMAGVVSFKRHENGTPSLC